MSSSSFLQIRVTAKGKEINDWSIFTAVELGLSKFAFLSHQGTYQQTHPSTSRHPTINTVYS